MKKLMIAFAAVVVAAGVQASSFDWKNYSGAPSTKIYQSDGVTGVAQNTIAYLFCTTSTQIAGSDPAEFWPGISQSELLKAVRKDGTSVLAQKAISGANGKVNSGSKIEATAAFSYGDEGNTYTFYYVLVNGDEMLISDTTDGLAQHAGTEHLGFTSSSTWSKNTFGEANYSTAGWYSTVPEPTSGLLLLLGVAGLALRRRRA